MGGACSTNGKMKNAYKILLGKPEDKRPFVKPVITWKGNSKY
jgi:hypothetical protein